jgi:hypothetical protein
MPDDLSTFPEASAVRRSDGRFVKGNPGGPGRPRRAVNEAADDLDRIAVGAARELIDVAIAQARNGNMVALKLLLDRGWPVHRRRPLEIAAPALARSDDFLPAQAVLTDAVLRGDVSPNEGAVIASLLDEQRRRVRYREIDEEFARRREEANDDEC